MAIPYGSWEGSIKGKKKNSTPHPAGCNVHAAQPTGWVEEVGEHSSHAEHGHHSTGHT